MAIAFRPAGSGDIDPLPESLGAGPAEIGGEFSALGARTRFTPRWLTRGLS